jgi:2,4-dienoyl-CoA reductase-like NADH-dependent reductase (Old Yellow Enzyme family)
MIAENLGVLFQPLQIKSLNVANRIVMAPMTRSFSPEGVPGENVAAYYCRRAEGEVGLILSEGTVVDRPASRNDPQVPCFYGEASLAGWQRVIDEVHAVGGKMGPQIWHVGAAENPRSEWRPSSDPESPSGLYASDAPNGKPMTERDISDTIDAFARAAAEVKRLGFDTLEIHGAHGYLIDEFFWDKTNLRSDAYGGPSIKDRNRFALEIIKAVRNSVGPDFPILFRVSQWKMRDYAARIANSPVEMEKWLIPLVEAGVDVLHCSQRNFRQAEFPEIDGEEGLNLAGWAKKLTGAVTISVGSVGLSTDAISSFGGEIAAPSSLEKLLERMARNEFDLIAVGRALLNDPQWVEKIQEKNAEPFTQFTPAAFTELI